MQYNSFFPSPRRSSIKDERFPLVCQIMGYKISSVSKAFFSKSHVIYIIQIQSLYSKWTIRKRYNDFFSFNKVITKKYFNLPIFPPKRAFSTSSKTIDERVQLLTIYMNTLFKTINVIEDADIISFINLDRESIDLYLKSFQFSGFEIEDDKSLSGSFKKSFNSSSLQNVFKQNYYKCVLDYKIFDSDNSKSAKELVIEEFLRCLESNKENKNVVVKTFENFLVSNEKWPSFSQKEIYHFFNGVKVNFGEGYFLKGFLYHVGNIQNNPYGSRQCLDLLAKLLNFEFNPDCSQFVKVFQKTKTEKIIAMELEKHFSSGICSVEENASNVIYIFFSNSTKDIFEHRMKRIFDDEKNIVKFCEWKARKVEDKI